MLVLVERHNRQQVDSKNDLAQQIDVTSRHQAAEKKKSGKKASQKSSALDTQMADFKQRMQDFEEGLDSIFEGVVMHRYRDVAAPIRQLALESLGQWVCAMPGSFLDDSYLKYLGWSLSDKDAAVRNTALCALIDIYSTENAADSLSLFTQRFKTRLIALTEDVSDVVGISAMKMMGLLAAMDGLEPEEMDMLLEFMFCETAGFSQNAGELFVKAVVENEINMLIEDAASNEISRPHVVLVQLCRRIVPMSKTVKDNVKVMYTVDALYDLIPELSNWEAYDELLNQDNRVQDAAAAADLEVTDTTMTVDEELFLFNLLHAALRRATGTLQIPGHRAVNMGSNQKKVADENAGSITEFFMAKLPEMFAKFGAEPEKARLIVEIPQLFDLSLYETKRMTKQFTGTLKAISATVMKNSDAVLLESCMATLQHFSDPELALHAKTEKSVAELLDVLSDRLGEVLAKGVPETPDNEEEDAATEQSQLGPDVYQMVATLARLNAFALEFDVSARVDDLLAETAKIIAAGIEGDVNEQAVASALQLYTVLLVVLFGEADIDPENIDEDAVAKIDTIVELRNEFQVSCTTLLESGTEIVQSAACKSLVDLCMIFTAQFAAATTDYGRLAFELDDEVQEKIFKFLAAMIDGIGAADKGPNKREKEGQSGRPAQRRRTETTGDSDGDDETEDLTELVDRMTLTELQVQEEEAAALTEHEIMELLSAFCNAVACGSVDSSFVGQLFPVYSKSQAISEIIRYTLSELRKVDAKSCYEAILYGIESMFLAAMADNSPDLTEVKEVAHRIALTYGFSNAKDETRRSIISIHRHGIEFALNCENTIGGSKGPPENIAFLEVLKEFSIKLHPQDKTGKSGVVERLETEMRGKNLRALVTMEEWNPYFVFLNNLSKKKGGKGTGKASAAKSTTGKKKASSKRKGKRSSGGGTRKRLSLTDRNADEDNFWGKLPPKKTQASDDESEIEDFASSHEGSARSSPAKSARRSSPVKSARRSSPQKRGRSRAEDKGDDGDKEDSPAAGAARRSTSSRAGRTRAAPVAEKLYSSSENDEEESDGDDLLDM